MGHPQSLPTTSSVTSTTISSGSQTAISKMSASKSPQLAHTFVNWEGEKPCIFFYSYQIIEKNLFFDTIFLDGPFFLFLAYQTSSSPPPTSLHIYMIDYCCKHGFRASVEALSNKTKLFQDPLQGFSSWSWPKPTNLF